MDPKFRSLLMRSNRLLGAQLVEHNLVNIDHLESANEKLLELINSGSPRQRTVLGVLAYELDAVKEEDILMHQYEMDGAGVVDLRHLEIHEELKVGLDTASCWATWSVPFDRTEDVTFVATAYYLSPAVRKFWEEKFENRVLWFGTTLENIADFLEAQEGSAVVSIDGAESTPS